MPASVNYSLQIAKFFETMKHSIRIDVVRQGKAKRFLWQYRGMHVWPDFAYDLEMAVSFLRDWL